jgi:hypothetical protein
MLRFWGKLIVKQGIMCHHTISRNKVSKTQLIKLKNHPLCPSTKTNQYEI